MTVALSMAMAEPTMVKDPKTNLIWEDTLHASEDKVIHMEAKAYCEALKLGTYENWRLPTLPELLTIVDYKRYKPAILKEFKHVGRKTIVIGKISDAVKLREVLDESSQSKCLCDRDHPCTVARVINITGHDNIDSFHGATFILSCHKIYVWI